MGVLNRLDEVPIANIDDNVESEIKNLEQRLNHRYYLIAFDRSEQSGSTMDI